MQPHQINVINIADKMPDDLGRYGEEIAIRALKRAEYEIIATNFKVPVGRNRKGVQVTGEIDVIGFDGSVLCFIEVKTRSVETSLASLSAVDLRKQRQITRASRVYRRIFKLFGNDIRFDVVAVYGKHRREMRSKIVKGFWKESKFKKMRWVSTF